MFRKASAKRGFTLIEVIVVLTILALLSAIVIPSMTGWIDKANEKVCAVNRAQLERYYAYEKTLYYGQPEEVTLAKVLGQTYAETKDDVAGIRCPSGGIYSAAGEKVSCSVHGESGDSGNPPVNGLVYTGESPYKLLSQALSKGNGGGTVSFSKQIDSTATNGKNQLAIAGYLSANGLDMTGMNVKTWKIFKESGITTYTWSDQSITGLTPGANVRVIRYNPKTGNYTAGYMQVVSCTDSSTGGTGDTYNILAGGTAAAVWKEYAGQTSSTKKSYEETLKIFNTMSPNG